MAGGGQGERKSSRIQGSRFPAEAAAAVACERPPGARTTGCGFDGLAFVFCRAPGAFHPQAVPPRLSSLGVASPKLSLVKRCPDVDVAKPADPESRSAQQRRLRPRRQPKSAPRGGSVADPPPLATPSGALDTVRAGGATPGGTHAPPAPGTSVPPCEIPNAPANDRLQALALSPDVLAQQDAAEFLEAGWRIVERSEDPARRCRARGSASRSRVPS